MLGEAYPTDPEKTRVESGATSADLYKCKFELGVLS